MRAMANVNGQMDILTLAKLISEAVATMQDGMVSEAVKEDYLSREEKILSLLRKKKRKDFKESAFLEALNEKAWFKRDKSTRGAYAAQRVAQTLIIPAMKKMVIEGDHILCEDEFRKLFCGYDNFDLRPANGYESYIFQEVTRKSKSVDTTGEIACYVSEDDVVVMGLGQATLPKSKVGRQWSKRGQKAWVRLADAYHFLAEPVLLCQLKSWLMERFSGMEMEKRLDDPVYCKLLELSMKERMALEAGDEDHPVRVDEHLARVEWVQGILREIGGTYEFVDGSRILCRSMSHLTASFLIEETTSKKALLFNQGRRQAFYPNMDVITQILDVVFEEYAEDKRQEEFARRLSESYARSFETKKNIPQKMLSAMERSDFNRYFGYVEFDEDCDLEKIRSIEKEFLALADYLKLREHKEVSLRFRKLGNHKALGLYYPFLKCLCVDISSPSSFSHEMFHMLDYEHGELSRGNGFSVIKELYKKEFDKIAHAKGLDKKLSGNGKYNRGYYFQPSEIFARCGEMYLTKVCHINNSLVKPDTDANSFAYPWTDELECAVKSYFDLFLFPDTKPYEKAACR